MIIARGWVSNRERDREKITSGIAEGLALFCTAEILIILTLWLTIRKREKLSA